MAQQLMNLDVERYSALQSVVPTQIVNFNVTAEVISVSGATVLLKVKNIDIKSKNKLSTQEILLQNMNDKLARIGAEQAKTQPTP